MSKKTILAVVALALACAAIVAVSAASAAGRGGRPELAAGPASGFVPANAHAAQPGAGKHVSNLIWGGGPVMHATTVVPIYWGTSWGNSNFVGDKVTGLDNVYSHVGGTSYLHTNSEYTDNSGNVNTTNVSKGSDQTDLSATPS